MPIKQRFDVNDNVLAADKGNMYSARILKVQNVGDSFKYFIHYNKWARKYDAWMDEHLIAKENDTKRIESIKATYSTQTQENEKKSSSSSSTSTTNIKAEDLDNSTTSSPKKRIKSKVMNEDKTDISLDERSTSKKPKLQENVNNVKLNVVSREQARALARSELVQEVDIDEKFFTKIIVPFSIKKMLVDEWGLITTTTPITDRKLILLPRKHSVRDVIVNFLNEKKSKVDIDEYHIFLALLEGLQLYFDKALPIILLYRQERDQFEAVSNALSHLTNSEIYGVEHLCRLFVKFPRLMSGAVFEAGEETNITSKLSDFIKHIAKNLETYADISDYVLANDAFEVKPIPEDHVKPTLLPDVGPRTRGIHQRK